MDIIEKLPTEHPETPNSFGFKFRINTTDRSVLKDYKLSIFKTAPNETFDFYYEEGPRKVLKSHGVISMIISEAPDGNGNADGVFDLIIKQTKKSTIKIYQMMIHVGFEHQHLLPQIPSIIKSHTDRHDVEDPRFGP